MEWSGRDVGPSGAGRAMHAQPTAVVFDVGHVLYDWHPRHLYAKLIPDRRELEAFLRDVVTVEWHFQHDAGRPFAETSAELIARHPRHRALIEAFAPRWMEMMPGPIPGMPRLVADLAAAGVPLYAITNFSAEFWPVFRDTVPDLFAPFRDIVVSGVEKLMKPDPAIFALAMRRFGLAPGEALFVDDRADNVAEGERHGLVGHVFDGEPRLRHRLEALGLLKRRAAA